MVTFHKLEKQTEVTVQYNIQVIYIVQVQEYCYTAVTEILELERDSLFKQK